MPINPLSSNGHICIECGLIEACLKDTGNLRVCNHGDLFLKISLRCKICKIAWKTVVIVLKLDFCLCNLLIMVPENCLNYLLDITTNKSAKTWFLASLVSNFEKLLIFSQIFWTMNPHTSNMATILGAFSVPYNLES